tara:strand:- start:41 stop:427 length:387 start_codon:yes stop_codon:yes gene_type:complete
MNIFKKMYQDYFGYKLNETQDIEEAQLINNLTDYRGGVEYIIRDPAEASAVSQEIKDWTMRKGFTIIKHIITNKGRQGYFYFRLGDDPGQESQQIQGYFAQKPELKHFRFNVKSTKPKSVISKRKFKI